MEVIMQAKIKNFVPNESDNLHCFQCCFKMIYDYALEENISMDKVEKLTNFVAEKPTWPYNGMKTLAEKGFIVKCVEIFNIDMFISNPELAIKQHLEDDDIAESIIKDSNLDIESKYALECLNHENVSFEMRIPNLDDIKLLLSQGYFIIVNVNYYALLDEDDYYGHFVVVEGIDDNDLLIQNPGLPPIQNQKVKIDKFLKAWQYPNEKLSNILGN